MPKSRIFLWTKMLKIFWLFKISHFGKQIISYQLQFLYLQTIELYTYHLKFKKLQKRWGVFQMENSTTPFWKVKMEHSHFLMKFSSDCHVPTKDFTLNESAFSNREILHQKNSGQLYSKRQARKSSNYLTGIAIKSNHRSVLHQAASSTAAEPGFPSTVCLPLIICHFSALPPTPFLTKKKRHGKSLKHQTEAVGEGLAGRSISICKDSTALKSLPQNGTCPAEVLGVPTPGLSSLEELSTWTTTKKQI